MQEDLVEALAAFAYSDLMVRAGSTTTPVEVEITLRNTGARRGTAVVQLYCRDDVASVARPDRLLLGFARVPLEPGQAGRLTFSVHPSRPAFFDPQMRFVVEPGTFTFSIGASATDIQATRVVTLDGEVAPYRQREIVATAIRLEACSVRQSANQAAFRE